MPRALRRFPAAFPAAFAVALIVATVPLARTSGAAEDPRVAARPGGMLAPPWIGVTMDKGSDIGVTVEHVVRGSPAERGGVRAGDRIVGVDGARTTAAGQVTRAVGTRRVGDTVSVELERRGTPLVVSLLLTQRPTGDEILRMDLVGAPAPGWSNVTPLGGAPASLAALRGRVVIVDFWASWCGPCRMLAPRLSALKDRLGAQGLSVVGITTDDAEQAASFAEKHQMRYGIVVDKAGDTSRAYGISGLPTMLLVDKNGVVRDVFVGFDPSGEPKLEASIKALLAEPVRPAAAPPATPPGQLPAASPAPSAPPAAAPAPPSPPAPAPLRPPGR